MSDRNIDISLNPTSTAKTISQVPTAVEVKEYEARIARVMERGLIVDRFHVDLPDDMHGEWHPYDTVEQARLETMGFRLDTQYAPTRKLHDKGDGISVIGDVAYYVQPKWMYNIIETKRKEQYYNNHLKKRQKEEKDFVANQASIGEDGNTSVSSVTQSVSGEEIRSAITPPKT